MLNSPISSNFLAIRPKLCRNCVFPQNFHTRKLGEITVIYELRVNWTQKQSPGFVSQKRRSGVPQGCFPVNLLHIFRRPFKKNSFDLRFLWTKSHSLFDFDFPLLVRTCFYKLFHVSKCFFNKQYIYE